MCSNTELFDFKFVDRTFERNKVKEFLQSSNNFLWIDGVHGVGKSFFIENYVVSLMKEKFQYVIYINKSSNEKNINYLTLVIEKMSKELPVPFEMFVRDHYSKLSNAIEHIHQNFEEVQTLKKTNILVNLLLNINSLFITKKKEEHSSSKVLFEYIQDIVLNSSAFIILDNFSYCEQESFRILEEMFIRLIGIEHLRILICTTTEERENFDNLNILLCEKIPHTYISMEKFSDAKYFENILNNKFRMTKWLSDSIVDIYNLCGGIPDNLRNFIRQLYIDNGIRLQKDKFLIAEDKAKNLLYRKTIDFDPSSLQASQKIIVQVLALFGMPIPFDVLENFILFIIRDTNSFQFRVVSNKLEEIIEELLECQIITLQFFNGTEKITFKHDNIYNALHDFYHEEKNAANVGFTHHLIYLYVVGHGDFLEKFGFSETEILECLAMQSYEAAEDDWRKYNKELALYYYNTKKLYSCNRVLSRFRRKCSNPENGLLLLMAEVFYEIAEYHFCIETLEALNFNELIESEKAKYYILYGKAISFCDSQKAVENFESAMKLNLSFENRCQMEYYCEMSYSELKDKLADAQSIFLKFYNNQEYKKSLVYASVLRSAVNIFSIKEAFFYLKEGLNIARKRADSLEEGKILNNLGFLYTRHEYYEKAYECFKGACTKLEDVKPFEMSYPLTNIVFIQMTMEEWEKALEYIETAFMYNKSDFIPYVLKAYKMVCLTRLNKIDMALEIKEQLLNDIAQGKITDYKMIKKSKMNCAYVAYKIGDIESKENLLQDCWSLVKDSFAQNRYLSLCKKMDYAPYTPGIKECTSKYDLYAKIDFEPWIVTFGHD